MYLVDDTGGRRMEVNPTIQPCDCPDCVAERGYSKDRQRINWQMQDGILDELNGQVMSISDLQRKLAEWAPDLRRLWKEEHELLTIQFGLNDEDLDFTVTAVFETPYHV